MTFCNSLKSKMRGVLRKVTKAVAENAATSLSVIKAIKWFVDTGVVDMAVLFTETKADDNALAHIKNALVAAIDTLDLVDKCKDATTDKEKIACLVEGLMKLSPNARDGMLIKLANLLTAHLSGNKEKQSFYDAVTQGLFTADKVQ